MASSNHNGTWTLEHGEYQELLHQARKLEALEAAGVDNWRGYDHAMEILHGDED
jgi:hypothetical protein